MPVEILLLITIPVAVVCVLCLRKRGTVVDAEGTKLTLAESIRKKIAEKHHSK